MVFHWYTARRAQGIGVEAVFGMVIAFVAAAILLLTAIRPGPVTVPRSTQPVSIVTDRLAGAVSGIGAADLATIPSKDPATVARLENLASNEAAVTQPSAPDPVVSSQPAAQPAAPTIVPAVERSAAVHPPSASAPPVSLDAVASTNASAALAPTASGTATAQNGSIAAGVTVDPNNPPPSTGDRPSGALPFYPQDEALYKAAKQPSCAANPVTPGNCRPSSPSSPGG